MRLLTTDLYEGAWLLTQGMTLADLWMKGDGKRSIVFEFRGDNMELLQKDYQKGKAEVNVLTLKRAMNELKDRMFLLLRHRETFQTNPCSEAGTRSRKREEYAGTYQEAVR